MSDWGKPTHCSECPRKVKQPKRGRARDTCSAKCGLARTRRRKRETRAAKNARRQKMPPLERAHVNELRHWMRTSEGSPVPINKSTPPTIVSTWLNHTCRRCT